MDAHKQLMEINARIRSLRATAEELNGMSQEFPAVAKNSDRILASIRMLELNVSDILGNDPQE